MLYDDYVLHSFLEFSGFGSRRLATCDPSIAAKLSAPQMHVLKKWLRSPSAPTLSISKVNVRFVCIVHILTGILKKEAQLLQWDMLASGLL